MAKIDLKNATIKLWDGTLGVLSKPNILSDNSELTDINSIMSPVIAETKAPKECVIVLYACPVLVYLNNMCEASSENANSHHPLIKITGVHL